MKVQFNTALVAVGPRDANDIHVLKFSGEQRRAVDLHVHTSTAREFAAHFGQADAVRVTFEAGEPEPNEIDPGSKIVTLCSAERNERERIVAWLRSDECGRSPDVLDAAYAIELGRHRKVSPYHG